MVLFILGFSAELISTIPETYNEAKEIPNYQEMNNTNIQNKERQQLVEQKLAEKRYTLKKITIHKGETLYDAIKKNCQSTDNIDFICYMAIKENNIKDVKNIQPGTVIEIKIPK